MRIGFGIRFHCGRDAAVGIALAQHRVDRAAQHLRIARRDVPFRVIPRLFRIIRHVEALRLQLGDRSGQLGNGCADVRQLDDIGFGRLGQFAQLGQCIADALFVAQVLGEVRKNASRERNVPRFDVDADRLGEGLDDREQRIGRQGRRFVGFGIDDPGCAHALIISVTWAVVHQEAPLYRSVLENWPDDRHLRRYRKRRCSTSRCGVARVHPGEKIDQMPR